VELLRALPADDINSGLPQEQVVVASGNPRSPLYPHRHFNQQGQKREPNARGRYDCVVCWKDYASTQSLRNHQRKMHEAKGVLDYH
jgi:hypothetical protein